jgi:thiamine biosynthesis protein ThiI
MLAINDVTTMPVIRPVACMDKIEIIDIARKIDTYDISIRPYEDCCTVFVPKSPVINPAIERCEQSEKRFEWDELLDECVAGIETITIKAGEPIRIDADTGDEICALL